MFISACFIRRLRILTELQFSNKVGKQPLSVADDLSGLGSTRVVRFCWLQRIWGDEPDSVATGPQDAKVQGCIEPMGAEGPIGAGSGGTSGDVGTNVSAAPATIRGGRARWACR